MEAQCNNRGLVHIISPPVDEGRALNERGVLLEAALPKLLNVVELQGQNTAIRIHGNDPKRKYSQPQVVNHREADNQRISQLARRPSARPS